MWFSRYSHAAHAFGDKLVVVGGVWLHADAVPGVVVIDLATHASVEFTLDTVSWHVLHPVETDVVN